MKIACIDAGNTRIKFGFYEHDTLLQKFSATDWVSILQALQTHVADYCVVSNVSGKSIERPSNFNGTWLEVSGIIPLPFKMAYQTPHSLGADRIAAIAAAQALYPHQNCLAFDIGTCITTDLLIETGVYLGGSISPGLQMRIRAMHHFTGKLPELTAKMPEEFTGKTTEACMQSGAYFGILYELQGIIAHYQSQFANLQIVFTGGDAPLFANHIKNNIFAAPDLVLQGLKEIALYHASNRT